MKDKDSCSLCKECREIEVIGICKNCCREVRKAFSYYINSEEVGYNEYKKRTDGG